MKLTAQQQLEQHQRQNGGGGQNSSFNQDDWDSLVSTPSLDQVLSHLNKLRLNNTAIDFILTDKLLQMLRKIHQKCAGSGGKHESDEEETHEDGDSVDLRKKYADLFALAVDDLSSSSQHQARETSSRGGGADAAGEDENDDEAADDNDNDDDDAAAESYSKKTKTSRKTSGIKHLFGFLFTTLTTDTDNNL